MDRITRVTWHEFLLIRVQIATLSAENLGKFLFRKELLILDQEGEDLVIGAIWFNSVMTAQRREITKIVDIRRFGIPEEVPVEFSVPRYSPRR